MMERINMDLNTLLQENGIDDTSRKAEFLDKYKEKINEAVLSLWREFEVSAGKNEDFPDSQPEDKKTREIQSDSKDEPVATTEPIAPVEENNSNEKDMKTGMGLPDDKAREQAKNKAFEASIKGKYISFPNGKVNHEYTAVFDVETQLPDILEVKFADLERIGLQYFPDEKQIKGVPTVAGDHKIEMNCKRKDWTEGKPLIQKEVTIIINPDPKSLWKNIPSEQDATKIEYPKPDSDKEFLLVKSKKEGGFFGFGKKDVARKDMVAASQRGRSHAIEGKPRDDDFKLYFNEPSEWYIMVVADGAGSAPFSRKGSQIACETAIDVCKTQLAEVGNSLEEQIRLYCKDKTDRKGVYEFLHQEIVGKAAFEAYKKVCEEADSKQRIHKEYATTLLLTICKKFDFGWFVGAFWVGDGGIGIYSKERQEVKILGEPDGGEFAGQTRFLTMPEIFKDRPRIRFEIVEDFTAVILMTDGVTDPKFETDANLNRIEKWNDLWDDLNGANEDNAKVNFTDDNELAAGQLLKWLDFWSRGNHDDRTIAILF
jgi:serine/threonine protein phosphatase PrpC